MILDIIILFFLLVSLLVGFKVGFLKYVLKIASILSGFIISLLLTSPCTALIMKTPIGTNTVNSVMSNITSAGLDVTSPTALKEILEAAGIPSFLTGIVSTMLGNPSPEDMVVSISNTLAQFFVSIIVFFVLLFGATIIIFLLKKFVDSLRRNIVFKVIDGILGTLFSLMIYVVCLFLVTAIIIGLSNINIIQGTVGTFITEQSQNSIGLFRYIYEDNIIVNLWNIIF